MQMEDISAALATGYKPDVALYSVICPASFDLKALESLCKMLVDTPLAVHVDEGDPKLLQTVIALGARGIIPPTCSPELAAAALQLIAAGGTYVAAGFRPWEPLEKSGDAELVAGRLTDRQRAVLKLAGEGMTNKEIARDLGITQNTVKIHIARLMRRFQVDNRVRLAVAASRVLPGP
jgi:two-component system nitrate/nitrite response regulator NarP